MSSAFRNLGSSKSSNSPPIHQAPAPQQHFRQQQQPYHQPAAHPPQPHQQQQHRSISIPATNVKRSSSAPDRQSASLAPQAHRQSRPPRRSHTVYAPGASPPLPPLPRNRSIEGPDDPRLQKLAETNRRSGFLPANVLGDSLDGLGLGFEQEVILDPQPPMPMPSPGEYSSATASPASSIEPPSPSLFHVPAPQSNKRISFMRKNHSTITRPNSMAVLESMAGTAATLEAQLEVELSPLPELDESRARVAVLRKRGSVAGQGAQGPPPPKVAPSPKMAAEPRVKSAPVPRPATAPAPAPFKLLAVPEVRKRPNKRHTIIGSPSYEQGASVVLDTKLEPIESTYKPLPDPDLYCLRPTVSVSTQTPVWETLSPPLRPPLPNSPPRAPAWSDTPPQAYAPFPLGTVDEIPPPPPAHTPPYQPVSPSIYSFVSHAPNGYTAPNPRRSSFYAPSGLGEVSYEEVYNPPAGAEGYRSTIYIESEQSSIHGTPSPQLYAIPEFMGRRRSSVVPISAPTRSSLPLDPTMQARPQVQTRDRPMTVFNPTYAPMAPAKPPQETVDYDTPYLNPDGSTGLGAYANGLSAAAPSASSSTSLVTPSLSPAPYSAPAFSTPNPFSTPVPTEGSSTPNLAATSINGDEKLYAPHSPLPIRRSPSPRPRSHSPSSPSTTAMGGERRSSTPPSARTLSGDEEEGEYEPRTPVDEYHPAIAIRKASVISMMSEEASIRRASLVRVSPPSSRPTSLVNSQPNNPPQTIPEVPVIPLQHRRTSEIIDRVVTRRASEPGLVDPIPGGGGAVPRLRGANTVSAADRASKGRSFFLVQALSCRPDEVLKRDFLDRTGSEGESDEESDEGSELSSDEESMVDVRS